MTVVTIHQPNYLPYIGYFHKILQADVFVSFDTAQYTKGSYINRNRVKTATSTSWITVPVKNPSFKQIKDIEIDNNKKWKKQHWLTLQGSYGKSTYFSEYEDDFKEVYEMEWLKLSELNEHMISLILKLIGVKKLVKRSSELLKYSYSDTTVEIIEMVRAAGGGVYLSGKSGRNYLDETKFTDIALRFHEFKHPVYEQRFGAFIQNLSIVDFLFNCGADGINKLSMV